jgi:hypothetical protein
MGRLSDDSIEALLAETANRRVVRTDVGVMRQQTIREPAERRDPVKRAAERQPVEDRT